MKNDTIKKLEHFNLMPNKTLVLSERYKDFEKYLQQTVSGDGIVGENNYLLLWDKNDLEELNDAYEVQDYLSGVILIGSDGGEIAYGIDTAGRFVEVPFIGMANDNIRILANDFDSFIDCLYIKK